MITIPPVSAEHRKVRALTSPSRLAAPGTRTPMVSLSRPTTTKPSFGSPGIDWAFTASGLEVRACWTSRLVHLTQTVTTRVIRHFAETLAADRPSPRLAHP